MPIQDRLTAMVGGKTSEEKKKIVSKSTIAERLDAVVHETTPPTNHDELSSLTEQYQQLRKQLSALVKALKKYSEMTEKMHKARDQVRTKLSLSLFKLIKSFLLEIPAREGSPFVFPFGNS